MITIRYDGRGHFEITPKDKQPTNKQTKALENIDEWFVRRNKTYTITPTGWVNEVEE